MKKMILALSTLALTTGAFAATSATTATTTTSTKKSTMDKILAKSSLGYFTEYTGPKLSDTSDFSSANTWNQLKAKYKINKSTKVFVSHAFGVDQEANDDGEQYSFDDVRAGVETWSKYAKGIKYRNRVRLESPHGSESIKDKVVRMRASHLVTGNIDSRQSLTGIATFYKWFYSNSDVERSQYDVVNTAVYVYALSDKLSLYTEYDLTVSQLAGKSTNTLEAVGQAAYLGVNYSFNKHLTLGTFAYMDGGLHGGMNISDDTQLRIQLSGSIF